MSDMTLEEQLRGQALLIRQGNSVGSQMDADLMMRAADELNAERQLRETAEAKANTLSEFVSSRQCPDHAGKWERGRCLQCELEKAEAELAAAREDLYHANQDSIRLEFIISKLPPLLFQQYVGVPMSASGVTRGAIDIGIDLARKP